MNSYDLQENYTIKLVKYAWIIYYCESHTIVADYINHPIVWLGICHCYQFFQHQSGSNNIYSLCNKIHVGIITFIF